MKAGDRWEVWIPQKLGYGSLNESGYPPPYSTLMYEIEVVGITTP
jgi:peptidylprolyl isomerase/FKBP-type peptidyl-prolyl cis-trans isomerase FklB